jgi:hypothetical protein
MVGVVPTVSWGQALAWRMQQHHLVERAEPGELVRVVSDICGLHAQVMSSAELSGWARTEGLGRDAVQESLWRRRDLVKLWGARGTLYLLPATEMGLWLSALGTMPKFGNTGEPDKLAVAVGLALEGQLLTREELATEVERSTGEPSYGEFIRSSWGSYLKAASFQGLICFGPSKGMQVCFTSPSTWLTGGIERPDADDALRQIARRFLAAYAPATAADLARWWLGPPSPRRVQRMFDSLGEEAVEVDVDGRQAWVLVDDLEDILDAESPAVARLLPAFDPWVIGADRGAPLLDPTHLARVFRPQGWISPVLLVNGQVAGVWKHLRKGTRLIVELEPFRRLPAWASAELGEEAERLADFLGCGEVQLISRRPGRT